MGLVNTSDVIDRVRLSAEGQRYVKKYMDDQQDIPSLEDVFVIVDGGVKLPVCCDGEYVWPLLWTEVVPVTE